VTVGTAIGASRAIAILGMHRSGTSALAGTLKEAGLFLGRVMDAGFALNPKGLQEPPAILYMQENLVLANGGSWHEPPATVTWQPLHRAVRDLFIESRTGIPVWGFKDPRTLLTLDGWLDVLPCLECVGIFRHPAEVAASLHQRNGFPIGKGCGLWEIYNRKLLAWHERLQFPIIEFVADEVRMEQSLRAVVAHLRLARPAALNFFEARHRHFEQSEIEVPASAQHLLAALRERALLHAD
jgi:hypothetical protein